MSALKKFLSTVWSWVRDFVEVAVTLAVIIIVLRVALGSHTLVPLVVVTSGSMEHNSDAWVSWLKGRGVGESEIEDFSFQGGFWMGDMIVTKAPGGYGFLFGETKVGDVIIFERDKKHLHSTGNTEPIIHRIVGVVEVEGGEAVRSAGALDCLKLSDFEVYLDKVGACQAGRNCEYGKVPEGGDYNFYVTKGDNNPGTDQCGSRGGIVYPVTDAQIKARGWIRLPYIGWVKLLFNFVLKVLFSLVGLA